MELLKKSDKKEKERELDKTNSRTILKFIGAILILFLLGASLHHALFCVVFFWIVPALILIILERKQTFFSKLKKAFLTLLLWLVLMFLITPLVSVAIDIEQPKDEIILSDKATLKGFVKPANFKIKVGETEVLPDKDGRFTTEIGLKEGENKITIYAYSLWLSDKKEILVKRELTEEEKIKKEQEKEKARIRAEEKQRENEAKQKTREEEQRKAKEAKQKAEIEAERKAKEETKQKAEEEVKKEAKNLEEQIKKLVQKKLEGENNLGQPYEDTIEINRNPNGKYSVVVDFNADDNLTKGMIKTGIQMRVAEIFTSLFTERRDIQKVTISAFFPLQDKYGNPFMGDIYKAELGVEEARKVNWSIDSATLALSILPKVYKVSYPYKIF